MTYKPHNRNEPTRGVPKATAHWFDDRKPSPPNPYAIKVGDRFQIGGDQHEHWMPPASQWYEVTGIFGNAMSFKMVPPRSKDQGK